jgi:uncharacterized tellurite resistance protein B-like protein
MKGVVMADRKLAVDLAKLLIAAAWADGELQPEEINSLKDLIFTLGEFNSDQWSRLQIYMDSAVSDNQRQALLDNVLAEIKTEDDKDFVLKSLRELFCADGIIDDREMPVLDELTQAVSRVKTDVFSRLSKMLHQKYHLLPARIRGQGPCRPWRRQGKAALSCGRSVGQGCIRR